MLQPRTAMRRHNDEVDRLPFRCAIDSFRAKLRCRQSLERNRSEIDTTQKGAHLRFRSTFGCFLVRRQVVDATAFRHQLRAEVDHMKNGETRTDFLCEPDRVLQTGE